MAKPDSNGGGDGGPQAYSRRHIWVVFVSLLLDLLSFTMILPLLPSLLDYYESHDTSGAYPLVVSRVREFGAAIGAPDRFTPVLLGGLLGSLFSLLQFLTAPVSGRLSDVYGRRPVLLLSLVGIAASYVLWYRASSFLVFVAARVAGGLSKGNVNLSSAIVTDVTDVESRGRGMAWLGVAFSVGFIVGPIMGAAFAAGFGRGGGGGATLYQAPAMLAIALSSLNVLFVYLALPESLPAERRRRRAGTDDSLLDYISPAALLKFRLVRCADATQQAALRHIGLVYFLYLFIFSGVEFTLTFHCHTRFAYTSMQQGYMFLYMGALMAVVQGGYVRRIPEQRMERTALVGVGLLLPSFVAVALSYSQLGLYAGFTLYALSTAVCVPCLSTIAARYGGAHQKGAVTGVFRSLGALARALGPVLFSTVFWLTGATVCYCAAAVVMIVPLMLLARFRPPSTAATAAKDD
ncbi:major facilitator superfamily domain-containing protein 10-like [Amphibalanus amphitrite]|uniref:major facilitator superfamily domain-containing protein 10-like n=1 Tax=Amphibalanus amphitrite TaxID=1232801 RepID=UPI001C926AA8|nr:major facilitator superfamily domain-containing protein 10-like [Amphibalanus amphitrite]XP_043225316.1 major facilitator superfamily domain-containing protein 10-like [Amphibalanus amphitrite]